jgi:hypothetical protein
VIEHARRMQAEAPVPPVPYVWVSPEGKIDVDLDIMTWSQLNWMRLDWRKAISKGIIDEDGGPLRKPEPEPVAA